MLRRLRASDALFAVICVFFFGLAAYVKGFSYRHVMFGGLPVYVGEFALAVALLWVLIGQGREWIMRMPWSVKGPFAVFVAGGLVRTAFSLAMHANEFGVVQILRDSALYYQSLWILFGFAMAKEERYWTLFFSALLLGVGWANIGWWWEFLHHGILSESKIEGIGFPAGAEAVSALFPLAFAVWPVRWAALYMIPFGYSLLGQFIFYLKRNWFFSFAFLAAPTVTFVVPSRKRAAAWMGAGIACAISLSIASGAWVGYRSEGRAFAFLERAVDQVRGKRGAWFFHDELLRDSEGRVVSYNAWRRHLWDQAIKGFLAAPWTGQGFGPRVVLTLRKNDSTDLGKGGSAAIHDGRWISGPHNSFLTVAFRMGFLGLIPLALLLLGVAREFVISGFRSRSALTAAAGFAAVFLYAAFNVCLENPHQGDWFWVFLGVTAGFSMGAPSKAKRKASHTR